MVSKAATPKGFHYQVAKPSREQLDIALQTPLVGIKAEKRASTNPLDDLLCRKYDSSSLLLCGEL